MPRMHFVMTRSGYGPAITPDRQPTAAERLRVRWYAPKPAWMDHIPGPWLRFGSRMAFDNHQRRTAA